MSKFRKRTAVLALALSLVTPSPAQAEPEEPVNVVVLDAPPPRRVVLIEVSPLPVIIGKFSANLVIASAHHHAIVFSPFWASTQTAPIYVFDDAGNSTALPRLEFSGFGAELGYRHYFSKDGPRGFFLSPSIVFGAIKETLDDGSKMDFSHYGVAADAGFNMLVADRVSLGIGGGLQYTMTSKPIATQQFPAKIFVNGGILPRLLLSIGVAL